MIKIKNYKRKSRLERLKEIKKAARKVFLNKGLRDTTMEDIINETTLSKGGFYYYFKSTKEIYFNILEDKSAATVNQLNEFIGSNKQNLDKLVDYLIESIFEEYEERKLFLLGMYETYYDNDFSEKFNIIKEKYVNYIVEIVVENYGEVDREQINEKINLIYTVYHNFVINFHLMGNKEVYISNQKYIKNLFTDILSDIFF